MIVAITDDLCSEQLLPASSELAPVCEVATSEAGTEIRSPFFVCCCALLRSALVFLFVALLSLASLMKWLRLPLAVLGPENII